MRDEGGGDVGGVGGGTGRVLRWGGRVEPVTELRVAAPGPVLVQVSDGELDPRAHRRVVAAQQTALAVGVEEGGGDDGRGVAPARGAAGERQLGRRQFAERHIRNHQRDRAVRSLLDAQIGEPAVEEGPAVERGARRRGEGHDVAGPAEPFVALRAVRGHGEEVAALGAYDVVVQRVHTLVGAAELADAAQVAGHDVDLHHLDGDARGGDDLGVTEAVEGELRLQFGRVAGQGVLVGGAGATQDARQQAAVAVEDLGVPDGHRASRRAVDAQPQPAGQVLARVDGDGAIGQGLSPGPDDLDDAHGWVGPLCQPCGQGNGGDRFPVVVDEARQLPAVEFVAEVAFAAVVQVRRQQVAVTAPPAAVGGDRDPGPVGQADFELGEQGRCVAVDVAVLVPGEVAAVPAVADRGTEGVRAGAEQVGDVVGGVEQPVGVAGPARFQQVVGYGPAVDRGAVHAERGHVQARGHRLRREVELPAEQRHGAGGGTAPVTGYVDGAGRPVHVVEQRGLHTGGVTPIRPPEVGADTDTPVPDLATAQRLRRPWVTGHRAGLDFSAGRGVGEGRVGRHLDLVGVLEDARPFAGQRPRQARLGIRGGHETGVVGSAQAGYRGRGVRRVECRKARCLHRWRCLRRNRSVDWCSVVRWGTVPQAWSAPSTISRCALPS